MESLRHWHANESVPSPIATMSGSTKLYWQVNDSQQMTGEMTPICDMGPPEMP
jgi:hypothetical protein